MYKEFLCFGPNIGEIFTSRSYLFAFWCHAKFSSFAHWSRCLVSMKARWRAARKRAIISRLLHYKRILIFSPNHVLLGSFYELLISYFLILRHYWKSSNFFFHLSQCIVIKSYTCQCVFLLLYRYFNFSCYVVCKISLILTADH